MFSSYFNLLKSTLYDIPFISHHQFLIEIDNIHETSSNRTFNHRKKSVCKWNGEGSYLIIHSTIFILFLSIFSIFTFCLPMKEIYVLYSFRQSTSLPCLNFDNAIEFICLTLSLESFISLPISSKDRGVSPFSP